MEIIFYKNQTTGAVTIAHEKSDDTELVELKANTTDAALEKHVPQVTIDGRNVHVEVGSTLHPMTEAHYIDFICLVSKCKVELKRLDHTGTPKADFVLEEGDEVLHVYEYCNLHGLWVK